VQDDIDCCSFGESARVLTNSNLQFAGSCSPSGFFFVEQAGTEFADLIFQTTGWHVKRHRLVAIRKMPQNGGILNTMRTVGIPKNCDGGTVLAPIPAAL